MTHCGPDLARTVTSAQVQHAVTQLRERRGRPAAEQMQSVLHALDLTVVPVPVGAAPVIPQQRPLMRPPH